MLNRLLKLLTEKPATRTAPSEAVSTALLLLELARSDFNVADVERRRIRELLVERYQLSTAELDQLLADAQVNATTSVSLHDYVQTLNAKLDADGKRTLIEMLWQVAYADGHLDKYEEHLLRRLADLLYIPMADYIQARFAAEGDVGGTQSATEHSPA